MTRPSSFSGVLGLSVSSHTVHAVMLCRGAIAWAGSASYDGLVELGEVIAHLAGECVPPARRARVALARDTVQVRTIVPAPPLKARAVAGYVALDAPRLFRHNGTSLVTDGALRRTPRGPRALVAVAVEEPLVRAVLAGCVEAGLDVVAVGPATDVLPRALRGVASPAVFPHGGTSEVLELGPDGPWRSRLLKATRDEPEGAWAPRLAALGGGAAQYAAAYGAAAGAPRLSLVPPDTCAAARRAARARGLRVAAVAAGLWLAAGALYVARLGLAAHVAGAELARFGPAVDSALAVRRDLATAEATLAEIERAARQRSRLVALLAELTAALDDSVTLATLSVARDGTVRAAGSALSAARAVAALERVPGLHNPRLEGAIVREARPGSQHGWDRFSVVARWRP